MTEKPDIKPSPFCLRLSVEERARLEHEAAGLSLGEYIRQCVFDGSVPKRRTRGKHPVKDHKLLGQYFGDLARSRLANNLNQLAKAANSGSLVLNLETQAALLGACADIREIRAMLIKALGLNGE